jgi:hypothetical protein
MKRRTIFTLLALLALFVPSLSLEMSSNTMKTTTATTSHKGAPAAVRLRALLKPNTIQTPDDDEHSDDDDDDDDDSPAAARVRDMLFRQPGVKTTAGVHVHDRKRTKTVATEKTTTPTKTSRALLQTLTYAWEYPACVRDPCFTKADGSGTYTRVTECHEIDASANTDFVVANTTAGCAVLADRPPPIDITCSASQLAQCGSW